MSNSILPAAGNLDIVNANVRADKFNAATNIGVANTNPDFNFSVGDKFHVDKDSTDPVSITGNVVASGIKISNLTIGPAFDFASVSNVGNVTANVIQFANATTGFTTTANVEIGGNITLTANAQVKVGSNVLAEYTGPHPREPKEVPIKKFPEIAFDASKLDGNDTTNTYTQAGYTVTSSSSGYEADGFASWKVFNEDNGKTGNNGWHTAGNPGNVSGSPYNTIDSSYVGEWLKLELPTAIKLSHVSIASRNDYAATQAPAKYRVYGSNNDSTWVQLIDADNVVYADKEFTTKFSTTTNYYKYLALVVQRATAPHGNFSCTIGEIQYYGSEEPAPVGDLSLDTTLKSTFNSVRSNNYVMYFDGEDPTGNPVVPKYLPSGTVKTITPNNIAFDATNNCWTLNGSTESNVTTADLGFEGDAPHTVSTWINASNLEANALTQQLFSIGSGYDKAFLKVDDTQIAANTWHNVTYAYQGEGGSKVTYVDGRKVEEAQVEDTFGEYPPFAMTDYETGGYRVSSNYENSTEARKSYNAFNAVGTGNRWQVDSGYSTSSPFLAVAVNGSLPSITDTNGTTHTGHWLKLELPHKLRLNRFKTTNYIHSQYQLKSYVILGSNDDVNWTLLHSEADANLAAGASNGTHETGISGVTESFKYLKLLVKSKANGTSATLMVEQAIFHGHKEGDLTRFPDPTNVLKYPHIAMTGPGQRGYVATASNETLADGNRAWHIFDENDSTFWKSDERYTSAGVENTPSGLTDTSSTAHGGEYVVLESPNKLKITGFNLTRDGGNTARSPSSIAFLGKNSAPTVTTGWTLIAQQTTSTYTNNVAPLTISGNSNYFKYHAVVIRSIDGNGLRFHIKNIELLGTQEDTGTPAIVGGPFAGKVANFRVYDQYLGDERIQEIYDAQKDAFGHKKSSMTFYKGRVGVGTTEPEGALTVLDERHAVAKFPARAVSADDSYVEGDGRIQLSAVEGSGYQAFDGLTSTSWTATPTRNTRLSEEVDFGAWLKIQTPESVSLKKTEIESNPDWRQIGSEILTTNANEHFGRAVACSHDGTRIIAGGFHYNSRQGLARVYDWNGTAWEKTTNTLIGTASEDRFGIHVAMSGDGTTIAVAARTEHTASLADAGVVRVYYLNGSTWTVLPDSGSLTDVNIGNTQDAFMGQTSGANLGGGGIHLSYDGRTLLITEPSSDSVGTNRGETRIFTYADGAWSQKGSSINGTVDSEELGSGSDMSEDGNHIVIGTKGNASNPKVKVYEWNGTNAWQQKGSDLTYSGSDEFGPVVSISNDGNTVAVGIARADIADGALVDNGGLVHVYHWTGSAWGTPHKLTYNEAVDEYFGSLVVLSGDGKRLLVGAPGESTFAGEILTYTYTGDSWKLRKAGVEGFADTGNYQYTGYGPGVQESDSVALSRDGSTIVTGALGHDTPQTDAGRVRVFSMPSNIKSIWGSNDNENWTKITTAPTREEATSNVAGFQFGYDDRLEFKNLDNPNYYKYHAIVGDAFTRLKDVKLYGIRNQGSSTLHDGALTLTKNLNVPRIGAPPDADDTPRRDRLVIELDTTKNIVENGLLKDTSGRENHGKLFGNVTYNIREKALLFGGQGTDYASIRTGFEGNQSFTISFWFKFNKITSGRKDLFVILGTSGVAGSEAGLALFTPGTYLYTHVNDIYNTVYDLITDTNIHHIAVTYSGGIPSTSSFSLYIDNLNVVGNLSSTNATVAVDFIKEKSFLRLSSTASGTTPFNGSISNLKLYDVALTEREIDTLYQMGRCNEGHHTTEFSKGRINFEPDTLTISKIPIQPKVWADGGEITEVDGFRIHTFFSSGTFHLYTGGYVEYLLIGGGGGGGGAHGGGGGAGGYLEHCRLLGKGTYAILVGSGGAGGTGYANGASGSSSTIEELRAHTNVAGSTVRVAIATGGGYGGHGYGTLGSGNTNSENGGGGASAGGSGPYGNAIAAHDYDDDPGVSQYVTPNPGLPYVRRRPGGYEYRYQGNNSGSAGPIGGAGHGGGGGGAGGRGINAIPGSAGYNDGVSGGGGPGVYTKIRGFPELLAGGGAGGRWGYSSQGPFSNGIGYYEGGGGSGGGGGGSGGGHGTTGSGGGGGGGGDSAGPGGNGGSGRVVIRYAL